MEFIYLDFVCEVDIYKNNEDIVVRFYDKANEPQSADIKDLVIVDAGYGYLCLKFKENDGILSGMLDENIFSSDEIVYAAIEFVESLAEKSKSAYIPYHVRRVRLTTNVEYNGEY